MNHGDKRILCESACWQNVTSNGRPPLRIREKYKWIFFYSTFMCNLLCAKAQTQQKFMEKKSAFLVKENKESQIKWLLFQVNGLCSVCQSSKIQIFTSKFIINIPDWFVLILHEQINMENIHIYIRIALGIIIFFAIFSIFFLQTQFLSHGETNNNINNN